MTSTMDAAAAMSPVTSKRVLPCVTCSVSNLSLSIFCLFVDVACCSINLALFEAGTRPHVHEPLCVALLLGFLHVVRSSSCLSLYLFQTIIPLQTPFLLFQTSCNLFPRWWPFADRVRR